MSWNVPQPYAVHWPAPLRWNAWWRGLSLCCMAVLLIGAGGYFWLKDARLLLYTFVAVVVLAALFGMLAGWMLYRFGVDDEHAGGLTQLNLMQERDWQRWAQQALPVLGVHAVFPGQVSARDNSAEPVSRNVPLPLPPFPGYGWLFDEMLMALLPELQSLVGQRLRILAYLPQGCSINEWRLFTANWQALGLPAAALLPFQPGVLNYAAMMPEWLGEPAPQTVRLVIVTHWNGSGKHTEGAVVCLLGSQNGEHNLPVRCSLHRPMQTPAADADADIREFLHYQPLTCGMQGLWTDAQSKVQADALLIAHSQRLKTAGSDGGVPPPALPQQHYLPHWLGKTGPCHDWFTVTLMMQMAQAQQSTQCAMISQDLSLALSSVSAGAFTDD